MWQNTIADSLKAASDTLAPNNPEGARELAGVAREVAQAKTFYLDRPAFAGRNVATPDAPMGPAPGKAIREGVELFELPIGLGNGAFLLVRNAGESVARVRVLIEARGAWVLSPLSAEIDLESGAVNMAADATLSRRDDPRLLPLADALAGFLPTVRNALDARDPKLCPNAVLWEIPEVRFQESPAVPGFVRIEFQGGAARWSEAAGA